MEKTDLNDDSKEIISVKCMETDGEVVRVDIIKCEIKEELKDNDEIAAESVLDEDGAAGTNCTKQEQDNSTEIFDYYRSSKSKDNEPFLRFTCEICTKCFKHKVSLIKHHRTHTGEQPFKCDTCSKTFTCRGNLVSHAKIHTGIKPFACYACPKKFFHRGSWKEHIQTNHNTNHIPRTKKVIVNPPSHKCETCFKLFRSVSNLKKHIVTHTGEKRFVCQTCSRAFGDSSNLKRHLRRHAEQKPFGCNQCDKRFYDRSDLNKHLQFHAGIKKFDCHKCTRRFSQRSKLRVHLLDHEEARVECENCGKSYPGTSYLRRHLRRVCRKTQQLVCVRRNDNKIDMAPNHNLNIADSGETRLPG